MSNLNQNKTTSNSQINNIQADNSGPKLLESRDSVTDNSGPKLLESRDSVTDNSGPKLLESRDSVADNSGPKLLESRDSVTDNSGPKLLESRDSDPFSLLVWSYAIFIFSTLLITLLSTDTIVDYSLFWAIRLIYLLFCMPFFILACNNSVQLRQLAQILGWWICLCFPLVYGSSWFSQLSFGMLLSSEAYLIGLLAILVCLKIYHRSFLSSRYIPSTIIFLTLPLFAYYLCIDIWHYHEPRLLLLSPLGWVLSPTIAITTSYRILLLFLTLLYPTCYFVLIYTKKQNHSSKGENF